MIRVFLLLCVLVMSTSAQEASEPMNLTAARNALIEELIREGITDTKVLKVMAKMPRHLFVDPELRAQAYVNGPLSIGYGQTISQPFVVAFMTQALDIQSGDKILEIGTGSGYQAAILAKLCGKKGSVYTIEIVPELATSAAHLLTNLRNVHVASGDGYKGWPQHAPFDKILLTAAPESIPETLLQQLKIGGKLVAPVGALYSHQDLVLITREDETHFSEQKILDVRFVPMVHERLDETPRIR